MYKFKKHNKYEIKYYLYNLKYLNTYIKIVKPTDCQRNVKYVILNNNYFTTIIYNFK